MARLNITLPDVLYARLEQLRDRVNLSKVCATALEKEVTMLEGQPPITDPRIAQLLQRLQSTRERWHQRGYEDGIQWAVDLATRDELQSVATHLAEQDGRQLAEYFQMRGNFTVATSFAPPPPPPHLLHQHPPTERGQVGFGTAHHPPVPPIPGISAMPSGSKNVFSHHVGIPFPGFPETFRPAERLQHWQHQDRESQGAAPQGEGSRIEIDESAYLEGWRDAVKGIWQTIAPALT
jgi:ribosome modulation factor